MGDPAGQLPDCLQAVGLPKPLLGPYLVAEGLVELGVLGFELRHQMEGLVTAGGRQGRAGRRRAPWRRDRPDSEIQGKVSVRNPPRLAPKPITTTRTVLAMEAHG